MLMLLFFVFYNAFVEPGVASMLMPRQPRR
jgi:hypothetical protein